MSGGKSRLCPGPLQVDQHTLHVGGTGSEFPQVRLAVAAALLQVGAELGRGARRDARDQLLRRAVRLQERERARFVNENETASIKLCGVLCLSVSVCCTDMGFSSLDTMFDLSTFRNLSATAIHRVLRKACHVCA